MHTNIQRVRSSREYLYPGSWFLSEEEKEARGGGRLIVRKEEAPPFASHRSLARFASSTVKIIIFFFREAADEEEEEERPRPLSSPGAEVGAETVLPASFRLRPVFPPRPPDGKGPPDATAAGEAFAS